MGWGRVGGQRERENEIECAVCACVRVCVKESACACVCVRESDMESHRLLCKSASRVKIRPGPFCISLRRMAHGGSRFHHAGLAPRLELPSSPLLSDRDVCGARVWALSLVS